MNFGLGLGQNFQNDCKHAPAILSYAFCAVGFLALITSQNIDQH